MPIKGRIQARDRASKIINERQKVRAKASALKDKFASVASPMQKRKLAKMGSIASAEFKKKIAGSKKTSPTTPEGLKKIKQSYIGYNPFGEAALKPDTKKSISSPAASVFKPKARAKAKAIKTAVSGVKIAKTMPSNKLVAAAPVSTASTEEYQKKGTMGKKKAPKIKAKAARRKQKGSRAATLKKGFGY